MYLCLAPKIVKWFKTELSTINISTEQNDSLVEGDYVYTGVFTPSPFDPEYRFTHGVTYVCGTDKCNNPDILKLLLQSVSVSIDFNKIEPLLVSNQTLPNPQESCLIYSNISNDSCPIEQNCTYCALLMETLNLAATKVCAYCEDIQISPSFYQLTDETIHQFQGRQLRSVFMVNCNVPQ
ncbi:unnamed protein product, partial [Didymodactylos carnosus]